MILNRNKDNHFLKEEEEELDNSWYKEKRDIFNDWYVGMLLVVDNWMTFFFIEKNL